MEFYRGDLQDGHPTFAEGSQAMTQVAGTPVEISAPKIVYSKDDDDAIDEFHRRTGSYNVCVNWQIDLELISSLSSANELAFRTWTKLAESFYLHVIYFIGLFQIGTCAMKPREQGGVVDARLNV